MGGGAKLDPVQCRVKHNSQNLVEIIVYLIFQIGPKMHQKTVFINLLVTDDTRYTTLCFYDWSAVNINNQVFEGDIISISHYTTRKPKHKSLETILSPKIRLNPNHRGPMDVELKISSYHFDKVKKIKEVPRFLQSVPIYNFKTIKQAKLYADKRIIDICVFIVHIGRIEREKCFKHEKDVQRYLETIHLVICDEELESINMTLALNHQKLRLFEDLVPGELLIGTNIKVNRNCEEKTCSLQSTDGTHLYKKEDFVKFQQVPQVQSLVSDLKKNPYKYIQKFNSESFIGGYLPSSRDLKPSYNVLEETYQIIALIKTLPLGIRTHFIVQGIIVSPLKQDISNGFIGYETPQDTKLKVSEKSRSEIKTLVRRKCFLCEDIEQSSTPGDVKMYGIKLVNGGLIVENHFSKTDDSETTQKYVIEIIKFRQSSNNNVWDGCQFIFLGTFKPQIFYESTFSRADTEELSSIFK